MVTNSEIKSHWEQVFSTKPETGVSWFQPYPKTSVEFLELFHLAPGASIIDIGAGDSHFVDVLLTKGYTNINILDIAENAFTRVKQRLGEKAGKINWIVSDILDFQAETRFDFWHDRAAFHFLTTEEKIERYIKKAARLIKPGGILVLGTFSESGPARCSGLEIQRYSETSMSHRFEKYFKRIKCIHEDHITPFNTTQNFLFCSFQRL
jgi:2-polyprenyl-3-methyl-5-hydroxy-6-metoxy-1,4-benzoquinol methylase